MAAYDLNVQKPASLAVPNSPGAADLARFLSVSESTRANQEREKLNQNMFDWEKGAGGRALTAADSERERVRQENMAMGKYSTDSASGYLADAQKGFRLEEDTLKQFDAAFPNATPEQREGMRQRTRETITKNPNAYVNQKTMRFDLENQFVNERGLDRATAASEAERIMASTFNAPGKMDEEVKKGFIDAIGDSGMTDSMLEYYKESGKSKGDSPSIMKSVKFLQENQTGFADNKVTPGSRPWYSGNLPFSDHELYTDDMNKLSMAIQQESGVNPMYTNAVILSAAENGKIPNGVSPEELMNKEGSYYASLKADAEKLQRFYEGSNRSGGDISLEELRGMKQNDMEVRYQALNDLNAALQGGGGKPLTSKEQYQIMSDPDLLREFDLVMKQTSNQNTGNRTNTAQQPNPAPAPAVPVDKGDNPELDALIRGEKRPGRGNPPASSTEDNIKALKAELSKTPTGSEARNLENSSRPPSKVAAELSALETKSIQDQIGAIEEKLSNPAVGSDNTKLFAELKSLNDKQDSNYVKSTKESVSLLTPGYLKNAIPDELYRSRAQSIVNRIKSGSASDKEVLELKTLFKKFGGSNSTPQPMLTSNTPVPSSQKAGPTGNRLSLAEMAYEPNQSEIYSQANGSEQIELNRSMLKSNFPNQFL
jgi:hypothetical protein